MCSWIRWTIARCVDDGQALPGRVLSHLAQCDACRKYYESHRSVADQLGVAPPAFVEKERTAFKMRILQAVDRRSHKTSVIARPIQIARFVKPLAAAATITLFVSAAWFAAGHLSGKSATQLAEARANQATVKLFSELVARDTDGTAILASARHVVASPVNTEVANLTSDIKRAASRLVACLPGLPALPSMVDAPASPTQTRVAARM